ncbi:MAG TPA: ribonuclease HI family protein [Thermoplasmata archaeon]|nr:ribonuclease HI family protein [Thermoplasmata archaeon]
MPARRTIECFFDGACKGNQFTRKGPMWVAYVIGDEEHVHEIPDLPSSRGPPRSNNIAEYQALILLLQRLHGFVPGNGSTRWVVAGDSQLVIYQMQGRYRVREPHLVALHAEARRLATGLPVTFRWVPRGRNCAGHLLESV